MQRKDEVEEAVQKDMRLQMRGYPRMKQRTSTTQLMALLTGFATRREPAVSTPAPRGTRAPQSCLQAPASDALSSLSKQMCALAC